MLISSSKGLTRPFFWVPYAQRVITSLSDHLYCRKRLFTDRRLTPNFAGGLTAMAPHSYSEFNFRSGTSFNSGLEDSGSTALLTPDSDTLKRDPWSVYPAETESWGVVGAKGDDLDDDEAYFLEDEDDDDNDDDDLDDDYDDDDDDDDEEEADTDVDSDDEDL